MAPIVRKQLFEPKEIKPFRQTGDERQAAIDHWMTTSQMAAIHDDISVIVGAHWHC